MRRWRYFREMYALEVSPEFISQVTEAVMAEVLEWQSRPLERLYPVVFFDCLRVKIRDEGVVRNKAIYHVKVQPSQELEVPSTRGAFLLSL